jgi:glutathione S-transferase
MMTTAHPIILHHFAKSPFSEKVRVVFGLKNIEWTSVLISRIMPRPDLMPLTGGYRRTPVMQIGADIYCDTQCIIRELERRFPEPTLFPNGYQGIGWSTAMWTDRSFFQNTVNLVFGSLSDQVPQDFIADREKLRGAKFDVPAMTAAIPQMRDQFRAHLQWVETQLGDGRAWMSGDMASLCDVNAYMNVWYVRAHLPNADECAASVTVVPAKCRPPPRSTSPQAPRRKPTLWPIPTIRTAASPATGSRSCLTTTARSK